MDVINVNVENVAVRNARLLQYNNTHTQKDNMQYKRKMW